MAISIRHRLPYPILLSRPFGLHSETLKKIDFLIFEYFDLYYTNICLFISDKPLQVQWYTDNTINIHIKICTLYIQHGEVIHTKVNQDDTHCC